MSAVGPYTVATKLTGRWKLIPNAQKGRAGKSRNHAVKALFLVLCRENISISWQSCHHASNYLCVWATWPRGYPFAWMVSTMQLFRWVLKPVWVFKILQKMKWPARRSVRLLPIELTVHLWILASRIQFFKKKKKERKHHKEEQEVSLVPLSPVTCYQRL